MKTMASAELNMAIAEACGWKPRIGCKGFYTDRGCGFIYELPDYTGDLNAMAEAEDCLTDEQKQLYAMRLILMTKVSDSDLWANYALLHATPKQRAEALLRTIGKWQE